MTDAGAGASAGAAAAAPAPAAPAPAAAPMPAPAPSQSLVASAVVPRDALAIEALLNAMGMPAGTYQPRVVAQLLEFQQRMKTPAMRVEMKVPHVHACIARYQREILEDAQDYARHRDKDGTATISVDDIELAAHMRKLDSMTSPPPKELLYSLAQQRNSIPLPIVPTREGVHLPADRFCLMQPNYRVKSAQMTAQPPLQRGVSEHKMNM